MNYNEHRRIKQISEALIECITKTTTLTNDLKQQSNQLSAIAFDLINFLNDGTNDLIKRNYSYIDQLNKEHKAHKGVICNSK